MNPIWNNWNEFSTSLLAGVLNSLWPSLVVALLIWLALRFLPRVNAATRHAAWWAVLAAMVLIPVAVPLLTPAIALQSHTASIQSAIVTNTPAAAVSMPMPVTRSSAGDRLHQANIPAVTVVQPALDPSSKPLSGVMVSSHPANELASGARLIVPLELHSGPWPGIILALWIAVSIFLLGRLAWSYFHLRGLKLRAHPADGALALRFAQHLREKGIARDARLLISSEIVSPMAAGFLRPVVMLPGTLPASIADSELDYVLLHELAHIARRDDWTNLLAQLSGVVLSLHPVAAWVLKRIERERELACDDWVVAVSGSARRYAATLALMFEVCRTRKRELLATGMARRSSHLGERIEMLLRPRASFATRASLTRVVLCVLGALVLLSAGARMPGWVALAQNRPVEQHAPLPPVPPVSPADPLPPVPPAAPVTPPVPPESPANPQAAPLPPVPPPPSVTPQTAPLPLPMPIPGALPAPAVAPMAIPATPAAVPSVAPVPMAFAQVATPARIAGVAPRALVAPQSVTSDSQQNGIVSKEWSIDAAKSSDSKIHFRVSWKRSNHEWTTSGERPVSEFRNLTLKTLDHNGPVKFEYVRSAGRLLCEGSVSGHQASGTFTVVADPEYSAALQKMGYEAPDEEHTFYLMASDVSLDFAREISQTGIKLSLEGLVQLKSYHVSAEFVRGVREAGYKDFGADDIARLASYHVELELLKSLKANGLEYSSSDIAQLASYHVTADYIKQVRQTGYGDLSVHDYTQLWSYHVSPELLKGIKDGGFRFSIGEVTQLASYHVPPDYVRQIRQAGYRNFSVGEITQLWSYHVDTDLLKGLKANGYEYSVAEIAQLASYHVSADYVRQVSDSGYRKLSVADYTQLASYHVSPEFLKGLKSYGYDFSIKDIEQLTSYSVSADYIAGLRKAGFKDLSVKEIAMLRSYGVPVSYLSTIHDLGFHLSIEETVKLWSYGVRENDLRHLQEIGIKNPTAKQILQLRGMQ